MLVGALWSAVLSIFHDRRGPRGFLAHSLVDLHVLLLHCVAFSDCFAFFRLPCQTDASEFLLTCRSICSLVSLRQLHGLLRAAVARAGAVDALQAFVTIELEDKRQIVLDAREADAATARIMRRCRIPRSVSQGLLP